MSAPLRSVGIALDIIDALADAVRVGCHRVGPACGRGQEHRPPHVRDARRTWPDRPHADRGYRLGLRLVELGSLATERTAVGDRGLPLLVELRNTLGETVQIGVPAGATWCTSSASRVSGHCATRPTPGGHPSTAPAPARCSPRSTRRWSTLACAPVWSRARATRSSSPRCCSPSWSGFVSAAMHAAWTRPNSACRRSLSRCTFRPTGRWWRRSRWSVRARAWSATTRPTTQSCCRPGRASSASPSPVASTPCVAAVTMTPTTGGRCRRAGGTRPTRRA